MELFRKQEILVILRQVSFVLFVLFLWVSCCGCATHPWDSSRWAMDIPEYKEKYDKPYEKGKLESLPRRIKQMSDARFNHDRTGISFGTGLGVDPIALGGELGISHYAVPWSSTEISLKGILLEGDYGGLLGLKIGQRIQAPTRLSPFVGIGIFAAASSTEEPATNDGIDNNGNLFVDEPGERKEVNKGLLTIYPEAGIQYWIDSSSRFTLSTQYHFNANGRDEDFLYTGISLTFFTDPDPNVEDEW